MASFPAVSNLQVDVVLVRTIKVVLALVALTPLIVMTRLLPDVDWLLPSAFFPFVVGKALYLRLLTQVAFGLWLLLFLRDPSYKARWSAVLIAFAVYVSVTLISSLLGVSPQLSTWSNYERMQGFVGLVHWLAFVWVLVSVYRTQSDWRALLNVGLAAGIVIAVLGVAQSSGIRIFSFLQDVDRLDITLGNATYVGSYMSVGALVAVAFLVHSLLRGEDEAPEQSERASRERPRTRRRRRRGGSRQSPQMFSPSIWLAAWLAAVGLSLLLVLVTRSAVAYALLLAVLAAFGGSYYLSKAQRESWWRAFWIISAGLFLYAVFLSATRGAVVGLAGAVIVFAVAYALLGKLKWVRLWVAGFVGVVLLLSLLMFAARNTPPVEAMKSSSTMLSRVLEFSPSDRSVRGRVSAARTGLRAFADKPIFGWGPGNYSVAYDRYVTAEASITVDESFDQAHNKPIEELVTGGVVGFTAYMAVWACIFVAVLRRARRQTPRGQIYTMLIGAALTGYFIQNLFLFDTPGTVVWFMLMLGYAAYLETERSPLSVGVSGGQAPKAHVSEALALRGAAVAVAVALAVALSAYFLVARPLVSSVLVVEALDTRRPLTWEQRIDTFQRAFAAFPPNANQPRVAMFKMVAAEFTNLMLWEADRTLYVVDGVLEEATRGEPEGWRLLVGAAEVYQQAAPYSPGYLALARDLIDRASSLAPGRKEVVRAEAIQYLDEGDLEGAGAVLDGYVAQYADAEGYFKDIRRAIESRSE